MNARDGHRRAPQPAAADTAATRRVAIVTTHPVQYYAPWFRDLARAPGLEPTVFYLEPADPARDREFGGRPAWDRDLLAGYRSIVLRNRAPRPDVSRTMGLVHPGILPALWRARPDALVLFGFAYATAWLALASAKLLRVPVLLRGDSHDLGREPSARALRQARLLFRRCDGFLATGAANAAYFARRGAPAERIFRCPHAVDATWFDPARPGLAGAAASLRQEWRIPPDAPVVLFAGKWIAKKQPMELAAAFRAVAPADARLVFVGDGELRPELERLARDEPRITLVGFVNQGALPAYYLAADVFALPSRGAYETWGLAVNEAMHLGVPCLVSRVVGCQPDLVIPGETGWICDPDDPASLGRTLATAFADVRADRRGWGERARARAAGYSYAAATAGLRTALETVLRR